MMGVPITFLDKYNPDQFEIVGNDRRHAQTEAAWISRREEFVADYYAAGGTAANSPGVASSSCTTPRPPTCRSSASRFDRKDDLVKTHLRHYSVEEILEGFVYNELEGKGLFGLAGRLVIQPEFQRHYIYGDAWGRRR